MLLLLVPPSRFVSPSSDAEDKTSDAGGRPAFRPARSVGLPEARRAHSTDEPDPGGIQPPSRIWESDLHRLVITAGPPPVPARLVKPAAVVASVTGSGLGMRAMGEAPMHMSNVQVLRGPLVCSVAGRGG